MSYNKAKSVVVVTVALNSAATIEDTIESVRNQRDVEVTHIIKDGGSTDETLSIVERYSDSVSLYKSSDRGIYDAMNQGFAHADGDVVCFLNSDDYFASDDVLVQVLDKFNATNAGIVYGDLEVVNSAGNVIRLWKSGELDNGRLVGRQLPHPAFFARREVLDLLDEPFDGSYRISADLKQQLLLINEHGVEAAYLPKILVHMRHGGDSTSSFAAFRKGWSESARAYREVTGKNGFVFVVQKVLRKVNQIRLFG